MDVGTGFHEHRLRIFSVFAEERGLPAGVAGVGAQHPAVRYELFFTDRRVDLLREGVDVAFRVTSKPPEAWVAQPVLKFDVRAYGLDAHPTLPSPHDMATAPVLLLGQSEEPVASQWQHDDGRREEVSVQASAWGSDLDGLIALARHGAGLVIAPDFCVEPLPSLQALSTSPDAAPAPSLRNVLPGWRLLVGFDTVQALTLPLPAGSETARALVRFVRDTLRVER
ncbi:LysR substrate binding domain protein [Ostertagia ostertagi]